MAQVEADQELAHGKQHRGDDRPDRYVPPCQPHVGQEPVDQPEEQRDDQQGERHVDPLPENRDRHQAPPEPGRHRGQRGAQEERDQQEESDREHHPEGDQPIPDELQDEAPGPFLEIGLGVDLKDGVEGMLELVERGERREQDRPDPDHHGHGSGGRLAEASSMLWITWRPARR